jgi:large subunit ribosomal protein L9
MRHVNLILQESVQRLGEAGDLVKVKVGFARNFLVPQGKAIVATQANVKELAHQKRVISEKVSKGLKDLNGVKGRLNKVRLEVEAQAGESGKLFGSVTSAQIGELLAGLGFEIDRRKIALPEPIKEVGEHKVSVRLHRDVIAEIAVTVTATD